MVFKNYNTGKNGQYSRKSVLRVWGDQTHSSLVTRFDEGGCLSSKCAGRIGRRVKLPPQFGQVLFNTVSAQLAQKVHSNVQMRASFAEGGRSLSQHSQFGLISSIVVWVWLGVFEV